MLSMDQNYQEDMKIIVRATIIDVREVFTNLA